MSLNRKFQFTDQYPTNLAQVASSSTSLASSSSKSKLYDVFLSFRGEDTRNSFTDHLYYALSRNGIETFRDAERLDRGEEIEPALKKAIEESRLAVVIFSQEYASSRWCLDELVHIVKCKQESGLEVYPVFYHVQPSEVRSQRTGKFREAFDKHEERYLDKKEMVTNWRIALREIANVSGWDLHNRKESEVIQEIAKKFSNILYNTVSSADRDLIGMDARIGKLESYLNLESGDVLTIGIWGMGGVGKTTLAEEVFHRFRNQFDISGFVCNVRSESKQVNGLVSLQKLLFESFFGDRNINVATAGIGTKMLKRVLRKKKVLIVLDDVDEVEQIEALASGRQDEHDCWGSGSRLIVTTRDKSTLRYCGVLEDNIYEMEKLTDGEAFQLLCQKAFKKNHAPSDFVDLSNKLVKYASGLPLAVKVLGSYLFGKKEVDKWIEALHRLHEDPDEGILKPLRISFDGLRDTEKQIFLDIACFFRGEDCVRVRRILESCGFYPENGIDDLIDKSLIKIERKKLWMHDLLQQMGWHIIRQESRNDPGKRSRLWINDSDDSEVYKWFRDIKPRKSWLHEDALFVLKENTGTISVEGLFLSSPKKKILSLSNGDPLVNMRNLRLLKIRNVDFLDVQSAHLSKKLRLMEWHECPLESLPPSFEPHELVEFKMPNSCIKQLWNQRLSLDMLVLMDVSYCQYLTKTPNFSTVPNLKRLILEGCESLSEVHPTIGSLQHLVLLNLKGCVNLESLPHSISLTALQTFSLSGCSKLKEFPEILGNMETLSELYLDRTAISKLPISIQHLKGLVVLSLRGCKNLLSVPRIFCSSLKSLYLSLCSNMDELPENIDSLEHLQELDACNTAIRKVPQSITLLENLNLLCFHGCKGLLLPSSFLGLSSLTSLNLGRCDLAEGAIPDDIGCLSSLRSLDLSGNSFVSIPESFSQLSELEELSLFRCSKLQLLPKLPLRLKDVDARCCPMLINASNDHKDLTMLNCRQSEMDEDLSELPHVMKSSLKRLGRLDLSNCQDLKKIPNLNEVPNLMNLILEGCQSLSQVDPTLWRLEHLVSLNFKGCVSLQSLPQSIFLKSLQTFILSGCSNLKALPEIWGDMENLSQLHLDGTALRRLPISMMNLKGLTLLNVRGCMNLLEIPNFLCSSFTSLKFLYMSGCSRIDQLPTNLGCLKNLIELDASQTTIRKVPRSIGLLKKIEVLNFYGCGLAEGAIPSEIGDLSSLQRLDLSENNFVSIPESISQLPKLRELHLLRCRKLQSLPKHLPFTLKHVLARDCPMLNGYADNLTIWDSDRGFCLINFGKFNKDEDQISHVPLPVPEYRIQLLLPKFIADRIHHRESFEIRYPYSTRIPNWWSEWNSGAFITVQLSDINRPQMGFALFVVFEILENEKFDRSWESKETSCLIQTDISDGLDNRLAFHNFNDFKVGLSYVLCFYQPLAGLYAGRLHKANWLKVSVSTSRPDLEVRGCGIHLISSQQDVAEFVQNLSETPLQHLDLNFARHCERILDSATKLESCDYVTKQGYGVQETGSTSTVNQVSSSRSNSNIQFKRELQWLSLLYEGRSGCEKTFHFCFPAPVISMPPWFFQHHAGDVTLCYIPRNLLDDQSWVGLELYVVFTRNTSVSSNCPISFFFHVDLCAHDHGSIIIHRSLKIHSCLGTPDQLVVLHVPRVHFPQQLNECQGISALFRMSVPEMMVQVCGSRLVFQRDLEDLIHSLAAGTLGEPHVSAPLDSQNQIYVKSMVEPHHRAETLESLEQCNVVEGQRLINCNSLLERCMKQVEVEEQVPTPSILQLQKYGSYLPPKQHFGDSDCVIVHSTHYLLENNECMIENVAQEDPKSSLAGHQLHIMAETLFYGSYSSSQWRRCIGLLLQYSDVATVSLHGHIIADVKHFNPSFRYNFCVPQKEMPKWFEYNCTKGSRMKFQLPPRLCDDNNWRGLAISTTFENLGSEKIVKLLCHLTTKDYCLNPIPMCSISKEELQWFHLGGFIWLSYIPRAMLKELNVANDVEARIYSNCPGLKVKYCGSRLLYGQEVEEFNEIITQCCTMFFDNLDLIRAFVEADGKVQRPLHADQDMHKLSLLEGRDIQDFHRDFIYNTILPSTVFPEWFEPHSFKVYSGTMQLPPFLCSDESWIGLALCASYPGYRSEGCAKLECYFTAESSSLKSRHEYRIPSEIKLIYGRRFIWLSYIPRMWFLHQLNNESVVSAVFWGNVGSWPDKCGLRLVYQKDEEMFAQLSISLTSFGENKTSQFLREPVDPCSEVIGRSGNKFWNSLRKMFRSGCCRAQ